MLTFTKAFKVLTFTIDFIGRLGDSKKKKAIWAMTHSSQASLAQYEGSHDGAHRCTLMTAVQLHCSKTTYSTSVSATMCQPAHLDLKLQTSKSLA